MTARRHGGRALAVAAFLAAGCSGPGGGESVPFSAPSPAGFDAVARTLDVHCGTLDCHGATGRNLRLYGYSGRRLDQKDVPGGAATTPLEAGVDYCSAISLEPELLARVVAEGGARPERLTLIRKARGAEKHVGKTVFSAGSTGDQCLMAWISGDESAVVPACDNSLHDVDHPPPPTSGTVDLSACTRPPEVR